MVKNWLKEKEDKESLESLYQMIDSWKRNGRASPYLNALTQGAPSLLAQGVQLCISSAWKDLPRAEISGQGAEGGGRQGWYPELASAQMKDLIPAPQEQSPCSDVHPAGSVPLYQDQAVVTQPAENQA